MIFVFNAIQFFLFNLNLKIFNGLKGIIEN
jgi:hypothetical protein